KHAKIVQPTDNEQELLTAPVSDIPLYLSPWTDAYPPCEEKHNRTGSLVRHLSKTGQPFYIITRSLLVKRDIDVIRNSKKAFVAISLNTLDNSITNMLEPFAPTAQQRAEMIEELTKIPGLRTVVRIDPIIPGVTDGERLEELLQWVLRIKPFAIGVETLRINNTIAERMKTALPEESFNRMMKHYSKIEDEPVHPPMEWRLDLFHRIAGKFNNTKVRASFCQATLKEKITNWDCRGGY
ncbi:MAG: hypothetical protein KAH31_11120, partial [Candidatus Sabulitectum sp.]|nr:hypothetical protein [Candidatus Sabulitectum sp.]